MRDLFYATPARLKFLKTDRSEAEAVRDVVRRLAMAGPTSPSRSPARSARRSPGCGARRRPAGAARRHPGRRLPRQCVAVDAEREGVALAGFAALPTLTRANSLGQYLFVNGRPVRDKLLVGAVRGAYADYLPRDRHPLVALFVTLGAREVDVNVHPAKTEVRFRDGGLVRGLIVRALQEALAREGQRAASTGGGATIAAFRPRQAQRAPRGGCDWRRSPARPAPYARAARRRPVSPKRRRPPSTSARRRPMRAPRCAEAAPELLDSPLGAARAQLHETYIVAQTRDGLVIVDQHAAHERLVYERMKAALDATGVARQILLIPEMVELDEADVERLVARAEELARFGLVIEPSARARWRCARRRRCWARSTAGLVRDLAEHMAEWDERCRWSGG